MELNCPFCGSAPLIFEAEDEYACGNEGCFMYSCCATKEEWNRRAESDLLAALKDCEARLALLVHSGRSKMLDVRAAEKARAAIARYEK